MGNYTKSFNFRNGVQVDDSNFIVNANGLVGIGTTIPEKHLDVRGNAKVIGDARISGLTSLTDVNVVGVLTVGSLKLDSSNGIINAYNKSQALKRSKTKNKGREAANAMVEMIKCLI